MKNEENIVNYDLSSLTLRELVNLYENVNEFRGFLTSQKIETEAKEDVDNE